MNGIFIIAHTPLASALRQCALHVFPEQAGAIVALDVQPGMPPEESLAQARILLGELGTSNTLLLTDVFGATPCNVAKELVDGNCVRLIAGVNLPMLLRVMTYRQESLDTLMSRALVGATQGVVQVQPSNIQNQASNPQSPHDQNLSHHQQ